VLPATRVRGTRARSQLVVALRLVAGATVVGLAYSLIATAGASLVFPDHASGSRIERDGQVVGSRLVGQHFRAPRWFHPRPSAGDDDGRASGAANLGPASPELLQEIAQGTIAVVAGLTFFPALALGPIREILG
jgi:K+-transporting ATPase ATPase C chain